MNSLTNWTLTSAPTGTAANVDTSNFYVQWPYYQYWPYYCWHQGLGSFSTRELLEELKRRLETETSEAKLREQLKKLL
jgi:hypothetical protein